MYIDGDEMMAHPYAYCGVALSDSFPYAYCTDCQETQHCAHRKLYKDNCEKCNAESDFLYDVYRERGWL